VGFFHGWQVRHSPLIYQQVGDNYVVVASKGGDPKHPAWYLNLLAEPEAEIRVGVKRMRARARTAVDAERADLWAIMSKAYPPYDDYQARAKGREIPVVVLEPIA
jgi:deazaflavin-dependent oxidoreductase (nitroreductase family)